MGGAITAVAATTTVGIGATTMAGGIIIAIGSDFHLRSLRKGCISSRPLFCSMLCGLDVGTVGDEEG